MTDSTQHPWFNESKAKSQFSSVTEAIREDGFYCLKDAVRQDFLKELQEGVNELISIHGKRYFSLIRPEIGSEKYNLVFEKIYNDIHFNSFLNKLANHFSSFEITSKNGFNILRVVTGRKTDEQSLKFHYDSTLVTALVPIFIPSGKQHESGHFIAFPNSRNIRSSALVNIIEKFFIQNKISQKLLPNILLKSKKKKIIELEPGNIYFFSGIQTLHANYPVNKEYIRATLLCFHGDPYPNSSLLKYIRKKRHDEENKNITK